QQARAQAWQDDVVAAARGDLEALCRDMDVAADIRVGIGEPAAALLRDGETHPGGLIALRRTSRQWGRDAVLQPLVRGAHGPVLLYPGAPCAPQGVSAGAVCPDAGALGDPRHVPAREPGRLHARSLSLRRARKSDRQHQGPHEPATAESRAETRTIQPGAARRRVTSWAIAAVFAVSSVTSRALPSRSKKNTALECITS